MIHIPAITRRSQLIEAIIKEHSFEIRQPFHDSQRVLEHAHEGGAKTHVAKVETRQETARLLAVEYRQLGLATRQSYGFPIVRNRLPGLGDGVVLAFHDVGGDPARDGLPVGFQRVRAEAKAGMEERLVVAARPVQVLQQSQQGRAIMALQLGLDVAPDWLCRFLRSRT